MDKGPGRVETRRIWTSVRLSDYLDFPDVRPVWCIPRQVFNGNKKTEQPELVDGITSLTPANADAKRLLQLHRGHWTIENYSHYVRDVTFNEDKSPIRTGSGPQIRAGLRNFAIGILRGVKKATNLAST